MAQSVWGNEKTQFFYSLTPDKVLNATESLNISATGRVLQLNSMENRVYEVEIDSDSDNPSDHFLIFKFYRPGRWTQEQILEEHLFLNDLYELEIPVIAPKKFNNKTLFQNEDGLYYCAFPKQGGRAIDEWQDNLLEQMGRLLGRVHRIGNSKKAEHRLKLDVHNYGEKNLERLLPLIPMEYQKNYEASAKTLFNLMKPLFNGIHYQRVHGDCHHGNTILSSQGPSLIDFDDMVMAPTVQDIWMVTPGRDEYAKRQRETLLSSYLSMNEFNRKELYLIESLRALRMIHFSAWIALRFEDQAFQRAFPSFNSAQYWEKEIYDLKTQISYIQDDLDEIQYL